jgi:alpha-D-ribose 1-methylphosphonate 5-triphosphate synthase subunit PhnG
LAVAFDALPDAPAFVTVRVPEPGLVMARGRIGGSGAPFNLGEVTVTRAVVRIESGEVGFGHVLGRDTARALMVAKLDALWQTPRYRPMVEETVIAPVSRRIAGEDAETRRKTAATRVNFFTLVRGEDG